MIVSAREDSPERALQAALGFWIWDFTGAMPFNV